MDGNSAYWQHGTEDMARYRVTGRVFYVDQRGEVAAVPVGSEVEVHQLETNEYVLMRWTDASGVVHEQRIPALLWLIHVVKQLQALRDS